MINEYAIWKTIHILGVVLFVGSVLTSTVWKALADRTGDPRIIAFAQRALTLTDRFLTGGGAILILLTGLFAIEAAGTAYWKLLWVHLGLGLYALILVLYAAVLAPIQVRQARLAREFADGGEVPEAYWTLGRRWAFVGTLTIILMVAAIVIMTLKPA